MILRDRQFFQQILFLSQIEYHDHRQIHYKQMISDNCMEQNIYLGTFLVYFSFTFSLGSLKVRSDLIYLAEYTPCSELLINEALGLGIDLGPESLPPHAGLFPL